MTEQLRHIVISAIAGTGLFAGLVFAFSLVVMRALLELPADQGMRTMQRINRLILAPLFLVVFVVTAIQCAVIAFVAWTTPTMIDRWYLFAGALTFLIGCVGVTALRSVPLNTRLGAADRSQAHSVWPAFVAAWMPWNHVRTICGLLATVLLASGLPSA
jgi:uncharacterized membrane protein